MSNTHSSRIALALDRMDITESLDLVRQTKTRVGVYKIHDLIDRQGPSVIKQLKAAGGNKIWVDAKLHDIPSTVHYRTTSLYETGANIISIHASGGIEMMEAAVEVSRGRTLDIYAVGVLSSMSHQEAKFTYGQPIITTVLHMARNAKLAGVHGFVCSAEEACILVTHPELHGLKLIAVGIRPQNSEADDQHRTTTPAFAIKAGAQLLVIGRPITHSENPTRSLRAIEQEITAALAAK